MNFELNKPWVRWVVVVTLLACPVAAQDLAPVPDAAALKDAEKLIKDLFKDEYSKKTPADRIALGKKLLDQAEATKDDATARYVLLREANAVAGAAADLATALRAAELLGKSYKVNVLNLKSESLQAAGKAAKSPDDLAKIAGAYLKLSKEATDLDDFPAADKAAAAAGTQAKKAQDIILVNRATARSKEIADLRKIFEKVRKIKETLAANPDDAAANLEIGQYECFVKGNWSVGLPCLAKGSDAALKDLAGKDLDGPTMPPEQMAVGDGWWDLAEKRPPPARQLLRQRAGVWYELALPKLTGLGQTKVDKRVFEIRAEELGRGTWIDVSDPKLYGQSGKVVTVTSGNTVRLSKPPEGEFDGFTVRVKIPAAKPCEVQIPYETNQKCLAIYYKDGQVQSAKLDVNTWRSEVMKLCPPKEEYLFTVLISEGEYVGYLDTREFFKIPTRREYFTPFELHTFGNKAGEATFDQIKLRRRQ